ncbi:MAG: NifB/NifX family molybdenum-iron cluster-binding protein [Deltaproteobacteria bacterium]|jgi:predicted Fe-Mo cluster-binding NifX family protein|nr:NifB/NifX family molybdenum-iron cluster-binding protein [Deltaproteobacteria bacterium]MBT4268206.1 NifB/NifX family molybdenum-iron cluster-binding protein [Deltaproteobacteria bacterium]MBT4640165.1 NifB/NifX family molybdenum-iron cluster-binding protein [Deltaproteobacteria bacterium]MBT6500700.1 NifB/NifX family molybdenum-iron cluster-binding protein [Deltaproteobacteria bacterium]MBT6613147.1 NifB/NifX family molybdenum-iron cluster-binding protein [Deltaproteobacteria bacterium]
MKIAITAKGKDINSEVDPRFGRAAYILIVDTETSEVETLDNQENVNRLKGSGIQAAAMIHNSGADVLLTGYCGPNAVKTLKAAKIKIAAEVSGSVQEAISLFRANKYSFIEEANVEGHWI